MIKTKSKDDCYLQEEQSKSGVTDGRTAREDGEGASPGAQEEAGPSNGNLGGYPG